MGTKTSLFSLPTRFGLAFILLAGVAACNSGGDDNDYDPGPIVVTPPSPPPPAALIEDSFGARFGTIFRAGPNTEPVDPVQSDISIPVDPTRDPLRLRP